MNRTSRGRLYTTSRDRVFGIIYCNVQKKYPNRSREWVRATTIQCLKKRYKMIEVTQ